MPAAVRRAAEAHCEGGRLNSLLLSGDDDLSVQSRTVPHLRTAPRSGNLAITLARLERVPEGTNREGIHSPSLSRGRETLYKWGPGPSTAAAEPALLKSTPTMDDLPGVSTAPPDDDAARYAAALELNARLRAQAAQIPSTDAGYGPSDGEGDDDAAKYQAAMELNARLRATAQQIPGYGPADGLQKEDGPPTQEDMDEIDQLQQALALNARLKRRQEEAEALARERAIAEAEAQRFREESLFDFRGPRKAIPRKRRGSGRRASSDPEKARIERDNAMLVRHMTDIQTARRPAPRPTFCGGHKAASAIRRKETSRKILRENHKIAAKLEKISDGVARRSSGYTRTKPLHEGPLQKRNREMALARRARPVLQQPDMTF